MALDARFPQGMTALSNSGKVELSGSRDDIPKAELNSTKVPTMA